MVYAGRRRQGRPSTAQALLVIAAVLLIAMACTPGSASPSPTPEAWPTPEIGSGARPAPEVRLPPGFRAYLVAEGLAQPSTLTLGPQGELFVGQSSGPVVQLIDIDDNGWFEQARPFADGFHYVNGLAFSPEGELYVSSSGRVSIARDHDGDGSAEEVTDVITGLTTSGHSNNGLTFGPDGKLYITNGSTCNDCLEADERSATMLQANPDGTGLRVYAQGLRNPYDTTFDDRGRLWSTDNGADPPCNTIDELNMIRDGGDYGWPYGPVCDSLAARGTKPVAELGSNTASTGLAFYGARHFPEEYRRNFFVTLWGSHPTSPVQNGRKLVRVVIDEASGSPRGVVDDFATGLDRPVDVIVDRDGTLLLADWGTGKIYRIAAV